MADIIAMYNIVRMGRRPTFNAPLAYTAEGAMNTFKIFVCATALISSPADSSWEAISDKELYCDAQLIVTGTLSDVKERYMYVKTVYGKDILEWHIDLGQIKDAKRIKGDKLHKKDVAVLFDSKGQDGPFAHTKVTHSAGENGIWIISERDYYAGHYRLHKPSNPLPLTEKGKIRAILKKHKCE